MSNNRMSLLFGSMALVFAMFFSAKSQAQTLYTDTFTGTSTIWFDETDPNDNWGGTRAGKSSSNDARWHSVFMFDPTTLNDGITITRCYVRMTVTSDSATGSNATQYSIYRSLKEWNSPTWNNYATGMPWTVPGGMNSNSDSIVIGTRTPPLTDMTGEVIEIDITSNIVAGWKTNPENNFGCLLGAFSGSSSATEYMIFSTPVLYVEYTYNGKISGWVTEDTNEDGIRQSGEPLLAGKVVHLTDGAEILQTTTTKTYRRTTKTN